MKKLLLAATLMLSLRASTCVAPARAQDRSWPEYSLGARVHIVGIGALQRLLNERGYRVQVDNQFGAQTKAALIRCIGSEQSITLWSPRSGALMHTLPGTYIAFSPDDAMVTTGADNTLRLWNIKAARSWRAARGTMLSIVRAPAG